MTSQPEASMGGVDSYSGRPDDPSVVDTCVGEFPIMYGDDPGVFERAESDEQTVNFTQPPVDEHGQLIDFPI